MMQIEKNKKRSTQSSTNRFRWTSRNRIPFGAVISTRSSRKTNLYSRITGWSLGILIFLGLFTYLTFIPEQTFAEVVDPDNRTMDDIHYMQEMNTNICATAKSEQQYQLIDYRDGKKYFVSRLKDGNCWMTQNLDYDIESTLYPATSDVKVETPMSTTGVTTPAGWTSTDAEANYYYDPDQDLSNQYYYYTHSGHGQSTACSYTENGLEDCESNSQFTPGPLVDNAVENHYLVGNYYSWYAATAQSGTKSVTSGEAPNSICPKGWKLPTSSNTNTNPASFGGLTSGLAIRNIYVSPYYFVYGGRVYFGLLRDAGSTGYYWSSTPNSTGTNAYLLYFDSNIYPSATSNRYYGYSVRCVNNPETDSSDDLSQPPIPPAHGTANISVTVSPVISLDVATSSTSDKMTAEFTKVSTSEIITNVSSNYQYTVGISTNQTKLLPSDSEGNPITDSLNYIPMIESDQDIKAGNISNVSAWGIKKKLSALSDSNPSSIDDNDVYSPVGTTNPEVFYKSVTSEALTGDKALVFKVGVGVDAKLPSGRYSTTVTLTASVI